MKKLFIGLLMSVVLSVNAFTHPVQKIQFIAVATDERNVFAVTNDDDDEPERLDLGIVNKAVERNVNLAAGKSKKFVAFVGEGHFVCITTDTNISGKVSIQANNVTLRSSNGTKYCSRPSMENGDVYFSFTNTDSKQVTFAATISTSKN